METSTNIKVALRCRPLNKLEKELGCVVVAHIDGPNVTLTDPNPYSVTKEHPFAFDHGYGPQTTQDQIYADLGVPLLEKALAGYNGTIFAYGQTGSGKTHSITGTPDAPGIIPRMNKDLFDHIAKASTPTHPFFVLVSYLELYNENIHDLMNPDGKPLKIREHPKLGVYVENLAELVVTSAAEIEAKMIEGNNVRHVAATKMNERSSRSHSVFTIRIEQKDTSSDEGTSLSAKINLVDLAGSERAGKTEAEGSTLKEASMINGSLSALGNVINALADPKKKKGHIPFRSSKLTRLLQESLGGNTITVMIAAISPADRNFDETLNTLQYANRAKNIQNTSKKNETNLARIIKELKQQIEELTLQLQGGAMLQQPSDLQRVLAELEFVKQQTWEEKRKLSQRYEANRWVSLAKNGMLQFKVNLLRQQTFQAEEEIEVLQDERAQLLAQIAGLDAKIGSMDSEVKTLQEEENALIQSQRENKAKVVDMLVRRAATKWKTNVLLRRLFQSPSKMLSSAVPSSIRIDGVVTFQEKLHQQAAVLQNLKDSGNKAHSLEDKLNYQTQEMQLLQEENLQIKQQNEALETQIGEKATEMEALCEEVANMLGSENQKIEDLTAKSKSLQDELQAARTATNELQELLMQEMSRTEELEEKVNSVVQENQRLQEIQKAEFENAKQAPRLQPTSSFEGMARMQSISSIYAAHVIDEEELIQGIERSLSGNNLGSTITNSVRDGVFLCKLINKAAPGTIDERVLNTNARANTQEARENINLCLDSARALGCNLNEISTDNIMKGEESSVVALIAEVVRVGQLNQVSVQKHTSLLNLKEKNEDITNFFKLSPEAMLLRWFNFHLKNANHTRTVSNFGSDLSDGENYAVLLNRLAQKELCDVARLRKETDRLRRANLVLEGAEKIGCKKYVTARDIVESNEERNVLFVSYLFDKYPEIDPTNGGTTAPSSPQILPSSPTLSSSPSSSRLSHSPTGTNTPPPLRLATSKSASSQRETLMQLIEENQGEKREERAMRVWINSLGLTIYVKNLATELQDGLLILQILDKVYSGIVNWKRVNKAPNSIYKKIENCNYCVELGKQLKFSLVGIAGKDIYDGNMKLSLALLSQVMQYYFLNMLKTLRFGGKEVKEEDMVKWMNDRIAAFRKTPASPSSPSSPSSHRITSFKDPSLSTGLVFIDLLASLRPNAISYDLVQKGETKEQCMQNAKYIISVARKIGLSTFLVPEDIAEVKAKMILAFVGSLMSLQD